MWVFDRACSKACRPLAVSMYEIVNALQRHCVLAARSLGFEVKKWKINFMYYSVRIVFWSLLGYYAGYRTVTKTRVAHNTSARCHRIALVPPKSNQFGVWLRRTLHVTSVEIGAARPKWVNNVKQYILVNDPKHTIKSKAQIVRCERNN